ncbi:hypothetical protein C8R43DRAFT_1112000 [Mycena crocata]|nr:hypothetical protein C8R43DRAFT_1112000 [Mycena crocata]
MTGQTVILTASERAICRVRYRQVATYIDSGPQARTPTDRVVQAIAGHYKNGKKLEHGPEYSDLLFPFGNPRAVSRHINKGGPHTEREDREIALAWVETQPKRHRVQILALLGLMDAAGDTDGGSSSADEEEDVKPKAEETHAVGSKRKHEEPDDAERDSKEGVLTKRPHYSPVSSVHVKQEGEVEIGA